MKNGAPEKLANFPFAALLFLLLVCVQAVCWAPGVSYEPNYPARYMGGEADIISAPNGARIYDKALKSVSRIVYTEPTVQNLGDGVWVIGGYSIANFSVIETPEGLIVYDTGDYAEEGKFLRQVIEGKAGGVEQLFLARHTQPLFASWRRIS